MNKNKYLLLWFFLGSFVFFIQDAMALRVDQCRALQGGSCEDSCANANPPKQENPADPVCTRLVLSDQRCCIPIASTDPLCTSVPGQVCSTNCSEVSSDSSPISGFTCGGGLMCCSDPQVPRCQSSCQPTTTCGNNETASRGYDCPRTTPYCCISTASPPPSDSTSLGGAYPLLEKIPGTDNISGSDLPAYISAIYKVALIVVTLSAVLMLSIGGFMYLTSAGNTSSIGTAKGIITDALIGLVIALSAWLVLYIINPDLIEITLDGVPTADVIAPPPSPGGLNTLPDQDTKSLAAYILADSGIGLDNNASCGNSEGGVTPRKNLQDVADGKTTKRCSNGCTRTSGCMDTTGLSNTMLKAIWAVGGPTPDGLNMRFTITSIAGGPHANDSTHYGGRAIDIDTSNHTGFQTLMDAFVRFGALPPNGNASSMCEKGIRDPNTGKLRATSVDCTTGGANHIHLIFPN